MNEEHVDALADIPLARKFMWFSRCRQCGSVESRRESAASERIGVTAGVRTWITASWAIVAVIAVAATACGIWSTIRQRANGISPIVGDEWSISRDQWREKFSGEVGKYIRVKVVAVSTDTVDLMACRTTYDDLDDADKCDTFDRAINSVQRAQLADIYQEAIDDVDSSRDDHKPVIVAFGIAATLIFLWRIISQQWKKRVAIADF